MAVDPQYAGPQYAGPQYTAGEGWRHDRIYLADFVTGGGPVGDGYHPFGTAIDDFVQTTNSRLAAGADQFFKPVSGLAGNIAGGLVDAVLPPSGPDVVVRYADGTRRAKPTVLCVDLCKTIPHRVSPRCEFEGRLWLDSRFAQPSDKLLALAVLTIGVDHT
jgi:hypothetical protein